MYKGFNVKLDYSLWEIESDYYEIGKELFEDDRAEIEQGLEEFYNLDRTLNGSKIQENWFPRINCDVFISHSHSDEDLALTFSGWLCEKFGIKAFVDSAIWGKFDELLGELKEEYDDDEYNDDDDDEEEDFLLDHVHMMLATSLFMMIDKTEDFSKQKVFYREISNEMNACIVSDKIFTNNKAYIVTGKYLEYFVVLFNSKLFNLILLQNANNTGGKGGDFINNILVPIPNKKVLPIIEKKVTQVINDKISDDTRKEMEIELDTMVYDLYELSQEERKYIESKVK